MAQRLDRIGQQVGDYRLLRWLGGGGCGHVYLAEHIRDRFQVALKLLHVRLNSNEAEIASLQALGAFKETLP